MKAGRGSLTPKSRVVLLQLIDERHNEKIRFIRQPTGEVSAEETARIKERMRVTEGLRKYHRMKSLRPDTTGKMWDATEKELAYYPNYKSFPSDSKKTSSIPSDCIGNQEVKGSKQATDKKKTGATSMVRKMIVGYGNQVVANEDNEDLELTQAVMTKDGDKPFGVAD